MTPKQLEILIDYGDASDNVSAYDPMVMNAARADLAAMRQPITAEALLADGWEVIPGAIDWYRRVRPDPEFFDVYIGPDPTGVIRAAVDHNDTGVPEWLDGLKTMHDLYELLRIVGA